MLLPFSFFQLQTSWETKNEFCATTKKAFIQKTCIFVLFLPQQGNQIHRMINEHSEDVNVQN